MTLKEMLSGKSEGTHAFLEIIHNLIMQPLLTINPFKVKKAKEAMISKLDG